MRANVDCLFRLIVLLTLAHPCVVGQNPSTQASARPLPIERRRITIPMEEAGSAGLDAWLLVPRTAGTHPLLLLINGWEQIRDDPKEAGPGALLPEALWFARRGWAVALVLRRGFGTSGGEQTEKHMSHMLASKETFEWLQENNAKDLRAAYAFLQRMPGVDASHTVAAGYYNAGSAAMWFARDAPPGLVAIVNFSGGWDTIPDWMLKGKVHVIQDVVTPAFTELGESVHTPMLWLYPAKGSGFGMKNALAAKEAFTSAGGDAEMDVLKNAGDKDRFLFGMNPEEWGPLVERFFTRLQLPAAELIPAVPEPRDDELPRAFSDSQKEGYRRYLRRGTAKAFAYSPHGAWGFSTARANRKIAEKKALSECSHDGCTIFASEE